MLTLHVFPGGYDQPSLSPFCTKSMVLMRLSGVEHEVERGDPRSSPTGKLPYLRHDGGYLADSGLIQAWLEESQGVDLDAHLSAPQRATGHLIRRTLEENLYWVLVYSRWIDEEGWAHQEPIIAPMLPAAVRWFLPGVLRRGLRKALHAHGIGRHSRETIYEAGAADLEAIEGVIEGPFLFGQELSSHDITIHAFVGGLLGNTAPCSVKERALACPKLVTLCEAVSERYAAA